jgi:hypothetical protein
MIIGPPPKFHGTRDILATHCQLHRATIDRSARRGDHVTARRPSSLHNPASKPRFLVAPMTCQTIGGQAPRGGIPRHPGSGRPGCAIPFAERAAWVLLWDLSGERARWRLPERSRFAAVPGPNARKTSSQVCVAALPVSRADPSTGGSVGDTSRGSWSSWRLTLLAETSSGLARGNAVRVIGTRHRLDRGGGKRVGCIRRELSWIVRHRLSRINRRVVVGVWTWLRHVDSPTVSGTGAPSGWTPAAARVPILGTSTSPIRPGLAGGAALGRDGGDGRGTGEGSWSGALRWARWWSADGDGQRPLGHTAARVGRCDGERERAAGRGRSGDRAVRCQTQAVGQGA